MENKHECMMRERLAEGDTRFALLDNHGKAMIEKIDKLEQKMDKIEMGIESIKGMFVEMRLNFVEEKQKAIEDMRKWSNENFVNKEDYKIIKRLVYGAVSTILLAVITALLSLIKLK